jgi:hypothetical protein
LGAVLDAILLHTITYKNTPLVYTSSILKYHDSKPRCIKSDLYITGFTIPTTITSCSPSSLNHGALSALRTSLHQTTKTTQTNNPSNSIFHSPNISDSSPSFTFHITSLASTLLLYHHVIIQRSHVRNHHHSHVSCHHQTKQTNQAFSFRTLGSHARCSLPPPPFENGAAPSQSKLRTDANQTRFRGLICRNLTS